MYHLKEDLKKEFLNFRKKLTKSSRNRSAEKLSFVTHFTCFQPPFSNVNQSINFTTTTTLIFPAKHLESRTENSQDIGDKTTTKSRATPDLG